MIESITAKNYLLLENAEIDFKKGFSVITGETGAGKSIIIGALGLIIGNRADKKVFSDPQKKCVLEAAFIPPGGILDEEFEKSQIEPEYPIIMRRVLQPNGKSRMFVNESPVSLETARNFGAKLIDIHSQHQNLLLKDATFRLNVVDAFAQNQPLYSEYKSLFLSYKQVVIEFAALEAALQEAKQKADYNQFLFDQLEAAELDDKDEIEKLEEVVETQSHAEEIKADLNAASEALQNDGSGAGLRINIALKHVKHAAAHSASAKEQLKRLESALIEVDDIAAEIADIDSSIEHDAGRLKAASERLGTLLDLQKRHHVQTLAELIAVREQLGEELQQSIEGDEQLEKLGHKKLELQKQVFAKAKELSASRRGVAKKMAQTVLDGFGQLGMSKARFSIELDQLAEPTESGIDKVRFLFAANVGGELQPAEKAASGGELSRLMLILKSQLALGGKLPTIIFDEIDTGISGQVAEQAGEIMRNMGKNMQVIAISHLPQVAARAEHHYTVEKTHGENATTVVMQKLSAAERPTALAKLLSGKQVTKAAVEHAEQLLGS
jgi:DNA repair protein RecN (Recombination protein N)